MSDVIPCTPCCSTTVSVNVPGSQGDEGTDGLNGTNSYSLTTVDFVVPAINSNVTVSLNTSLWMVEGQVVVTDGPAHFEVVSTPTATTAQLKFLGYPGDVAPTTVISQPATVSPAGVLSTLVAPLTVYASGSGYALTATPALLDLGTTDPSLTLTSVGTYLILSRVRYDYAAATFAASQTVTTKLRRTNNTAADLTNGTAEWKTQIITTQTYTAHIHTLPPVVYTTANANDQIEIFGSVSVVPSAGVLEAVEAEIIAVRLF